MDEWFRKFSHRTAEVVGHSHAFILAVGVIAAWAVTGPIFHFSDTWQLVINTGTTIVTFLMVFLIQNTQNRDAHALHLKLDELIRANAKARNALLGVESMSDAELDKLQREFESLRDHVVAVRARRERRPKPPPVAPAPDPPAR
jgi:low affinity Fe/Cu permease